jgi:hypothetical protein
MRKIFILLNLFIIITSQKNLKIQNLKSQFTKLKNFGKAFDEFKKVVDVWPNIVSAFKTTSSTTIRDKLHIDGYSKFDGRCTFELYGGIDKDYWNKFKVNRLLQRFKMKPEEQKKLKVTIEDAQYSDKGIWNNCEILHNPLDKKKKNGLNFFSIIINNIENNDDQLNVVVTQIQTKLELAPDLLVINKDRSFVGGIYGDCKDSFKKVPKDLTMTELNNLMQFFQVFFISNIGATLGFKLELPEF